MAKYRVPFEGAGIMTVEADSVAEAFIVAGELSLDDEKHEGIHFDATGFMPNAEEVKE